VSNIWETRYRLLLEQLEALANQLRDQEPTAQAVRNDQLVRVLTGVVMLLRQHRVNKQGQCSYCGGRWRFWRTQPQCTVYRCLDFALRQPLDMEGYRKPFSVSLLTGVSVPQ
jgi:hypothetical protein